MGLKRENTVLFAQLLREEFDDAIPMPREYHFLRIMSSDIRFSFASMIGTPEVIAYT